MRFDNCETVKKEAKMRKKFFVSLQPSISEKYLRFGYIFCAFNNFLQEKKGSMRKCASFSLYPSLSGFCFVLFFRKILEVYKTCFRIGMVRVDGCRVLP